MACSMWRVNVCLAWFVWCSFVVSLWFVCAVTVVALVGDIPVNKDEF